MLESVLELREFSRYWRQKLRCVEVPNRELNFYFAITKAFTLKMTKNVDREMWRY